MLFVSFVLLLKFHLLHICTCEDPVPSRLCCMGWSDDILFNQPGIGIGFPRNFQKIESYKSIAKSVHCIQWSHLFINSLHINLLQYIISGTWQRDTFSKNFNSVLLLGHYLGKLIWFRIPWDIRIRKSENPLSVLSIIECMLQKKTENI